DGIAERRVHDDDAARGCGRDVDIVDANAGAADYLEIPGPLKHLRRHFGRGTDGQPVIISDRGSEPFLVLAERRLKIDLDAAILENLHGSRRQRVRNKNLWHDGPHAALGSEDLASAKAHSSHGVSASRSRRSTVAPHQMRKPGGASR